MVLYGRQWLSAELVLLLSVLHEEHVCGGPEGCAKHININNTYFLREELVYGQVMSYWEDSIGFFLCMSYFYCSGSHALCTVTISFEKTRHKLSIHAVIWQVWVYRVLYGCFLFCFAVVGFFATPLSLPHSVSGMCTVVFAKKDLYTSVMYICFTHDTLF